MADLPRLRLAHGHGGGKTNGAMVSYDQSYKTMVSPKPPVSVGAKKSAMSPRSVYNRDARVDDTFDAGYHNGSRAATNTKHEYHSSPTGGGGAGGGKQFNNRTEALEYYTKGYIKELEGELDSQVKSTGAWKIRYFVELFRLTASRNHNKRITNQVTKQIGEIQALEQHALDLSKQNAVLVNNADAKAHGILVDTMKADISGLNIQLESLQARYASEKASWEALLKSQKDSFDAEMRSMKDEFTAEVKYLKDAHDTNERSMVSMHVEQVKELKDQFEKERHAFTNAQELKDMRVRAAKFELQEKICQELVVKVNQLEGALQQEAVDRAGAESEADSNAQRAAELEAELEQAQAVSTSRQESLDVLSKKLQSALQDFSVLQGSVDPQFTELLKHQLDEAVNTRNVTAQLNLEAQVKIHRLEKALDDANAKLELQGGALDDKYRALQDKYDLMESRAASGEFTNETSMDKLKSEMEKAAALHEANLLLKRDIHILETELNSVRVNLKVSLKEVATARTDKDAAEKELTTSQIENKTYKAQLRQLQIESAADRIAAEELKKIKEMVENESNQRLAETLAESNQRVAEAVKKGALALEQSSNQYRTALEQSEERVEQARRELASNAEKMVGMRNKLERQERLLHKTQHRVKEMEGSDYETNSEYDAEDDVLSESDMDSDGEAFNTTEKGQGLHVLPSTELDVPKKTKRKRLKAGRVPGAKAETSTSSAELQKVINSLELKMKRVLDGHVATGDPATVSSVSSPFHSSTIGGAAELEANSLVIMRQRLQEAAEVTESKGMYISDLEARLETLHEEFEHSVAYSRYLEDELFTARKKEIQGGTRAVGGSTKATTVMPVMPMGQGNGRATTAAKGQGRNGNGGQDVGVVKGVSVVAGEIAGKSLGAFLGATVYDDDLNPYHHVTKVYLNHGGEIGLDGKQHITPWFFNPLLSSHGEDQHKRYEARASVAVLRGELESQAFQVQSYLEETVSVELEAKMRARMGLQEWNESFIKIHDRKPLEADKIRSPKFTVLAEEYLLQQRKLEKALEEFHEPSYIAEQKRVEYEEACEQIQSLTGHRPPHFQSGFSMRPDLAWVAMENPLAVTDKFPDWWFPSLVNDDLLKYVGASGDNNGDGGYDPPLGSELAHPGLGVVVGPDEESEKRFNQYEETISHLQSDVTQLMHEKEHYLTLIDHLQLSAAGGAAKEKGNKKLKKKTSGSGSGIMQHTAAAGAGAGAGAGGGGGGGTLSRMSSTSSVGSASTRGSSKKAKKKKKTIGKKKAAAT